MINQEIRIERLVIRLRGISLQVAQVLADGLGREILEQLVRQGRVAGETRLATIGSLDLGTLPARRSGNPKQLSSLAAHAITDAIRARLPEKRGG